MLALGFTDSDQTEWALPDVLAATNNGILKFGVESKKIVAATQLAARYLYPFQVRTSTKNLGYVSFHLSTGPQ